MIKTRQKNIRAFEIDNVSLQECIEFLKKNAILLRDYLIIFTQTPQDQLKEVMQELKLAYLGFSLFTGGTKEEVPQINSKEKQLKIISKPIRSGEEIEHDGDLLICDNIHNGARVFASGNLSIFGKCEGRIECGGNYLILKSILGNHIIFAGQIFSEEMLDKININNDTLKLVVKNGDCITIKEIR